MFIVFMVCVVLECGFCAEETDTFMQRVSSVALKTFGKANSLWHSFESELRLEKVADDFVQGIAGEEGLSWDIFYGRGVQPVAAKLGQEFIEDMKKNTSIAEKIQKISELNIKKSEMICALDYDKSLTVQQFVYHLERFHCERKKRIEGMEGLFFEVCCFLQKQVSEGAPASKSISCVQSVLSEMHEPEVSDGPLFKFAVIQLLNEGLKPSLKESQEEYVRDLRILHHFYRRIEALEYEMYSALNVLELKRKASVALESGQIFIPSMLREADGCTMRSEGFTLSSEEQEFLGDRKVQNVLSRMFYGGEDVVAQGQKFSVMSDFVQIVPELIAEEKERRFWTSVLLRQVQDCWERPNKCSREQAQASCVRLYCWWVQSSQKLSEEKPKDRE